MKEPMTVYTRDGNIAAEFNSVKREGSKLIVDGKALGAMQMDMVFSMEEVLKGIKMALGWSIISFMLLLPYFLLKRCFSRKSTEV